jgi:hypothetical protein
MTKAEGDFGGGWDIGIVPFDGEAITRESAQRWVSDLEVLLLVIHMGLDDKNPPEVRAAFRRMLLDAARFSGFVEWVLRDGETQWVSQHPLDEEQRQAAALALSFLLRNYQRLDAAEPYELDFGNRVMPAEPLWASLVERITRTEPAPAMVAG